MQDRNGRPYIESRIGSALSFAGDTIHGTKLSTRVTEGRHLETKTHVFRDIPMFSEHSEAFQEALKLLG